MPLYSSVYRRPLVFPGLFLPLPIIRSFCSFRTYRAIAWDLFATFLQRREKIRLMQHFLIWFLRGTSCWLVLGKLDGAFTRWVGVRCISLLISRVESSMDFRIVFYIDLTTDFFMSHFTTRLCFNVSIERNRRFKGIVWCTVARLGNESLYICLELEKFCCDGNIRGIDSDENDNQKTAGS